MLVYVIKRSISFASFLLILLCVTFVFSRCLPGSPFTSDSGGDTTFIENLHHLRAPIPEQFTLYLQKIINGTWGESLVFDGLTVCSAIKDSFPLSLTLGLLTFMCSLLIGIPGGLLSAYYNNQCIDKLIFHLSMCGRSLPGLLIASFIQYAFSIYWPLFPIARVDSITSFVLPVLSLSILYGSYITQLVRQLARDTLQEPYILTAQCKNISKTTLCIFHILKNSAVPLIPYLGPLIARLITGCLVVEKVYALPGLGSQFLLSIQYRDYPLIIGITVFCGLILIVMNYLIELILPLIDPRIQLKKSVWKSSLNPYITKASR